MAEFVCQYGNCDETDIRVTVSDRAGIERPKFCCREHAALYLIRRAWQIEGGRQPEVAKSLAAKVIDELK